MAENIVEQILGEAAQTLDEAAPSQPQEGENAPQKAEPVQQNLPLKDETPPQPEGKEGEQKPEGEPTEQPEAPQDGVEEGSEAPKEEDNIEELERLKAIEERRKQLEEELKKGQEGGLDFDKARSEAEEKLAVTYAEELRRAVGEDADMVPEGLLKAIPKIVAKAQLDAAMQIMQALQQSLPQIVQQQLLSTQRELTFEEAFYARWPQLREHADLVKRVARVYFQANPDVDPRTAIEEIGAVAAARARVPIVPQGQQVVPQPQPQPQSSPIKPGATSSGSVDDNPFSQMYQDFIEEDL